MNDSKEIQKTSQELIRELQTPSERHLHPIEVNARLAELIERRVVESYRQSNEEYQLGKHVHAIMKFFKGVK